MTEYSKEKKDSSYNCLFEMKVQQNVETIEEDHLKNIYGAKMIFEEDEEIQMDDVEQALP